MSNRRDAVRLTATALACLLATTAVASMEGVNIGNPSLNGYFTVDGDEVTVVGVGTSLWSWTDSFQFACEQITGDATVTVRLVSYQNIQTYTKAGIMFRESLDATAMNAFCGQRSGTSATFQRRTATAAGTAETRVGGSQPLWLRLTRSGDDFTAYKSSDGVGWTQIGETATIPMSETVYVGLAVAAGADTDFVPVLFDNIDGLDTTPPANVPPTADAGEDQTVTDEDDTGAEPVDLDGSGSTDGDGVIVDYVWTEGAIPLATSVTPQVVLAVGSHTIRLDVTDDDGDSGSDTVVITVNPKPGNQAPIAEAGQNQFLIDADMNGSEDVTLDGSGSYDADGSITGYVWTEGATQIATGVGPTVTMSADVHTADLTVTDNEGATGVDSVLIVINAGSTAPPPTPQTVSEYKSGISLKILGTYGADYIVEQQYHEPLIDPHCTIYIRSDVDINLLHNDQNIIRDGDSLGENIHIGANGLDGIPDSGDEGVIRYRVDQDMTRRAMWADSSTLYPAWPGPQSFDDMEYDPGVPVVGATGPLGGGDITDTSTFYWRGIVDSVGDEWHIIAVGDDDTPLASYYANRSSDGKIYTFIVNPATPACNLICKDAGAQFYTTPPKTYFVPVIRDQTTYLLGNCDIELAALGGAEVRYSLTVEGQVENWQVYDAPINTVAAGLQSDTRYELKYRIGQVGPVKTRIVHFDPAYPSDSEQHPKNIMWADAGTGLPEIRDRITREPYATEYDRFLNNPFTHRRTSPYTSTLMTGERWAGGPATPSSFPLLMEGFDTHPECSEFLYKAMLDTWMNLDPVGLEGIWSLNSPTREICSQGYANAGTPLGVALSYDWVIKTMRAGSHPHGFTAIEDYKIRDNLAAFCNWTAYTYCKPGSANADGYSVGMWNGAWTHYAAMIAAIINNYDSDLYGTSGAPGGVYNAPRPWTPFPDHPMTWWNVYNDKNALIYGYPNLQMRGTFWGLLNENYEWADRTPYWGVLAKFYYRTMNFRHNFDGYHYPHLDQAIKMIAEGGQVYPLKWNEGPLHHCSAQMVNRNFPEIAAIMDAMLSAGTTVAEENYPNSMWSNGVWAICLYDDQWDEARPGDANGDGKVDLDDFVILKINFGADPLLDDRADFDDDGDIDLDDFVILKINFGTGR